MKPTVFLFGEAEKGEFGTPLVCHSLAHLCDTFGEPPQETQGVPYAIQTLLYDRQLVFYRVTEEGFSTREYIQGLRLLKTPPKPLDIHALLIPGVGDAEIIEEAHAVCSVYKSLLVITQRDLYDYLTAI